MGLNWNRVIAGAALFIGGIIWSTQLASRTPGPMSWQTSQTAAIGSFMMSIGFGIMYASWRARNDGPRRRR
ncbi:hypothetical protein [Actinocrinis sp.]|uniref:hypothetical protein n=1 Tax=Actinocrinis sp. TaxID=1920516 RepID=UPI002D64A862|nr:hypothetical protein [Actinocrinis sp.]HZP51399.1 hypothetical protein [Actinocrinis sp.]